MSTLPDRDPTDLGLLSDADAEVIELRHYRDRTHTKRHFRRPSQAASPAPIAQPETAAGPATPEAVHGHVTAIYAQNGWEVDEDEQAAQSVRCPWPACRSAPRDPCTVLDRGRRKELPKSHDARLKKAKDDAEALRQGVEAQGLRRG